MIALGLVVLTVVIVAAMNPRTRHYEWSGAELLQVMAHRPTPPVTEIDRLKAELKATANAFDQAQRDLGEVLEDRDALEAELQRLRGGHG